MSDIDLEERLRDLGAAMRATAPDRLDAARALVTVQEDEPARRRWIAPALITAVAAAVVGMLVWFARPDDSAEPNPPAEPTPSSTLLRADWQITSENWDGRGGRCLTVAFDGEKVHGCVEGNRLRVSLWAAIGDEPVMVEPTGAGYTIGRQSFGGDIECDLASLVPGRLHEVRCGSVVQQVRLLPGTPERDFVPVGERNNELDFEPVRVYGVRGVTAYVSQPRARGKQCVVVLADDRAGWREACTDLSTDRYLAIGVDDAMWVVHVPAGGAEAITVVSAATSGSIHGCAETMPRILRRLDPSSMADGLVCSGPSGMVTSPVHLASSWAGSDVRPTHACIGDDGCGERSATADPLPIPPGGGYRPATDDVTGIDRLSPEEITAIDVPADPDARDIGRAVSAHFTTQGEPVGFGESIEVVDEQLLVLVEVPVLDDSAGPDTYAVWLEARDEHTSIDRIFRLRTCARGMVDTDDGPACV